MGYGQLVEMNVLAERATETCVVIVGVMTTQYSSFDPGLLLYYWQLCLSWAHAPQEACDDFHCALHCKVFYLERQWRN